MPPPCTHALMSRHPLVLLLRTRIGGLVVDVLPITRYEDPACARISVLHPPLPHHGRPIRYTIASEILSLFRSMKPKEYSGVSSGPRDVPAMYFLRKTSTRSSAFRG